MSDLVNNLRIAARYDHSQGAMMVKAADTIEQLQQRNAELERERDRLNLANENQRIQVNAGLRFSRWMKEIACKADWNPSEARSDYDAVIGYVGMLEDENSVLRHERDEYASVLTGVKESVKEHGITVATNYHPQQSLAEHDAEVARKAIEIFCESKGFMDESNAKLRRFGREYAQRNYGVKDGE